MNELEFAELMQHLRQVVRQLGRADLDEMLLASRLANARTAKQETLRYLERLRAEFSLGTTGVTREIMRRLQPIRTDTGAPIDGIELDVMPQDLAAYGSRTIDLSGSPELDQVIADLDELLAALRES